MFWVIYCRSSNFRHHIPPRVHNQSLESSRDTHLIRKALIQSEGFCEITMALFWKLSEDLWVLLAKIFSGDNISIVEIYKYDFYCKFGNFTSTKGFSDLIPIKYLITTTNINKYFTSLQNKSLGRNSRQKIPKKCISMATS